MATPPPGRLREHPRERFAPPVQRFDLEEAAAKLRLEPGAGQHGHRQITLYKHGPSTVALFLFDEGAGLREHQADGFVTIHVLEGELTVAAEAAEHRLPSGTLLTLAPMVPHDLYAVRASRVLLSVALESGSPEDA